MKCYRATVTLIQDEIGWIVVLPESDARVGAQWPAELPLESVDVPLDFRWRKWSRFENQKVAGEISAEVDNGGWFKKCESMRASVLGRIKDSRRKRSEITASARPTEWNRAVDVMRYRLSARTVRRSKTGWEKWSDTCSKNHGRKDEARKTGNQEYDRIEGNLSDRGGPEL